MNKLRILLSLFFCFLFLFSLTLAPAKTLDEWLEGYESGADWFGEDFHYDITKTKEVWDLLIKPITVLDLGEKEEYYPRKTPDGEKVNNDKLGGFIHGSTAAVHVLGEDENGWTLIEGLDYYDRLIQGYVPTKLLISKTPNQNLGIVVDKLTQTLYMFVDGELFSSVLVSTGLPNDKQPYNETAAGEYLIASWVGDFDSEGMICAKAIRFNNGDLFHAVPYTVNADGSKNYKRYEPLLGRKASHGCIRVQYKKSPEGLNQEWLWEHLKKNTKVLIWDDDGRKLPYPDDALPLYYNPEGGQNFHADEYCAVVKDKYLPLKGFTYGELSTGIYADLTPCMACTPPLRKEEIDESNRSRGIEVEEVITTKTTTEPSATLAPSSADDDEVSIVIY